MKKQCIALFYVYIYVHLAKQKYNIFELYPNNKVPLYTFLQLSAVAGGVL